MTQRRKGGVECLDCASTWVEGIFNPTTAKSSLWNRYCRSCKSSNLSKFDYDDREAKIAANPPTLSKGEVIAFVNSWLIQYHPKKSESSLDQKSFGEKCGWEHISSASWNGEFWLFPQGRFYEATRSVDRSWPPECFK
jgi:hypothetical protein